MLQGWKITLKQIAGVFISEGSQKQPSSSLVRTLRGPGREWLDARNSYWGKKIIEGNVGRWR